MSLVVNQSDRFPVGTSVGAYPRAARHADQHPSATALETKTVAADGSLTFTTLTADAPVTLYAKIGEADRYVDVSDSTFTAPAPGLIERIDAFRTANGVE